MPDNAGLYDDLSAYENLDFYGKWYGPPEVQRKENIQRFLTMLGLWEKRDAIAGTFSKGMSRKAAIARALIHEPELLFMDEPTANLDPESAKTVRDFILEAAKWDAKDAEYLFIGCGSSYYISQAASASWGLITGRRAWAVPASEVLLYPDLVLNGPAKCQPVLVSRSGHSSEVVRAAQYLERTRNIRTLAISCSTGHPLEEISAFTIHLLPADEKSVVMTRSFTSMLLGLQSLAAHVARRKEVTDGLRRLPAGVQPILDSVNPSIQEFACSREDCRKKSRARAGICRTPSSRTGKMPAAR